jgi:hypothetical protein
MIWRRDMSTNKGKYSNNCVKSRVNLHFPDGCPRTDTHDFKKEAL